MKESLHPARRHLRGLTSLRFFAALWVVLHHFALPHLEDAPVAVRQLVLHGQEGVTLFFVLSGFILAYTYGDRARAGRLDAQAFWRARFARVYPVFAFSLLLALPLTLLFLARERPEALRLMPLAFPLYAALLHSWVHPLIYVVGWNTPSWSLSAESFFYAAFPALAPRVARLSPRGAAGWMVGLLLLTAGLRLLYALLDPDRTGGAIPDVTTHLWRGLLYYDPLLRLPEFAFGILLAGFLGRAEGIRRGGFLLFGVVAGILVLLAQPIGSFVSVLVYPLELALFGALILLLAGERAPLADRALAFPTLVLLGEASYSLYMLQRPVAALFDFALAHVGVRSVGASKGSFAAFVVLLVFASIVAYRLVEVPFRERLRPRPAPPPAVP